MSQEQRAIVETLDLEFPVEYIVKSKDGERTERVEKLEFARLKAGDIEDMSAQNMKIKDFYLPLARSTSLPISVVKKLDSVDFMKSVEIIGGFLGSSQETGENQ